MERKRGAGGWLVVVAAVSCGQPQPVAVDAGHRVVALPQHELVAPGAPHQPILDWTPEVAARNGKLGAQPVATTCSKVCACPDQDGCMQFPSEIKADAFVTAAVTGGYKAVPPYQSRTPFEWAPVAAGPRHATVEPPLAYAAGTVWRWDNSGDDIRFAHPFGFDIDVAVKLDAAYALLVSPFSKEKIAGQELFGLETDQGLFPRFHNGDAAYSPRQVCPPHADEAPGGCDAATEPLADRILVAGTWIMDCGHPDCGGTAPGYHTEIHPPALLALARMHGPRATETFAYMPPYRVTQLYHPNADKGIALDDSARFDDPETVPFAAHFFREVNKFSSDKGASQVIEAHGLVEAVRLPEPIAWQVCAATPDGAGAPFVHTETVVHRPGVKLDVAPDAARGCVTLTASMDASYHAAALPKDHSREWPWEQIVEEVAKNGVSDDEIQRVMEGLAIPYDYDSGEYPFNPIIDSFTPATVADTHAQRAPDGTHDVVDDALPFPFVVWAWASWGPPPRPPIHTMQAPRTPAELVLSTGALTFRQSHEQRPIAVRNGGEHALVLGAVTLAQPRPEHFRITYDTCSGIVLDPEASCLVRVATTRKKGTATARVLLPANDRAAPHEIALRRQP